MRLLIKIGYPFLLLILLLPAACSGNASAGEQTKVNPTAAPGLFEGLPVNSAGTPLVARVNGIEITLPEFQRVLGRSEQDTTAADDAALAHSVLNTLIEQTLIDQAADALNISVSDADLDMQLQANKEQAGDEQQWQNWLAENQFTEAEFRDTLRTALITMMVRDVVTNEAPANIRQVHARHILVTTEVEAKAVMSRLAAGEDFARLAAELSKDVTSSTQGGDLGWFTQDELLEPALAQVAFALQPGQIAGPVATRLGYHIIQALEFADRPVDAEKQAQLVRIQFENWLQTLVDKSTIERYLR